MFDYVVSFSVGKSASALSSCKRCSNLWSLGGPSSTGLQFVAQSQCHMGVGQSWIPKDSTRSQFIPILRIGRMPSELLIQYKKNIKSLNRSRWFPLWYSNMAMEVHRLCTLRMIFQLRSTWASSGVAQAAMFDHLSKLSTPNSMAVKRIWSARAKGLA